MDPMLSLLIIVLLAYLFGELANKFGIPTVVGQLFAGVILGIPTIKNYILVGQNVHLISFMADLGILLLFFFVGLQINMADFKKYFSEAAYVSVFNTAIPFILGFIVFKFVLGYGIIISVIVGMCLSVSSQSVPLAVLDELKMIKTKIAKHIITAGAVDDVLELVMLSVILTLIHASVGHYSMNKMFFDIGLFVVAILFFRFLLIPMLLRLFAKGKSITHLFTGAIVVTLVMAVVTLYLGIGSIVGALFAGIIVREILLNGKHKNPWEEHSIAKAIHIMSFGFFVPLFFAWVGMNTSISVILSEWKEVLLIVGIAFVGIIGGSVLGILAHKGSLRKGFIVGWGLVAKGDVELAIATLALEQGLITETIFSSLIIMALITTLVSPIVFKYVVQKHHRIR